MIKINTMLISLILDLQRFCTFPFTSPRRILSTLSSSLESHKPPFSSSSPTPPAPSLNSTMANGGEHRNEIAFFDVETTFPTRTGQGHAILEFGSILVCPKKLVELESYSTLVRPHDLSLINTLSVRCNGITKDAVLSASTFSDIADRVYDILHGRIWAGHNILRFDCYRIREAFALINRSAPEPKGTIDSLALLTQKFGRRAGDMKMASLATYFGLGQQSHRSLGDVRMNLEVLKYCATVLFLESSLPDIFTEKSWVSPNATTRSRSGKAFPDAGSGTNSPSSSRKIKNCIIPSSVNQRIEENHPILSFVTHNSTEEQIPDLVEINTTEPDPFDLGLLGDKNVIIDVPSHEQMDEQSSRTTAYVTSSGCTDFLLPHEVSIPSISVAFVPFYRGSQKLQILHSNLALQIRCSNLKVRFGLSTKFLDHAGRPRLSFVVDLTPDLSGVLDACDDLAKCLFNDSGSDSEWRPVVARKPGFFNTPTIRLHVPMISENNNARWTTEIYQKDMNSMQQFVFSGYDVAELEALVRPGSTVDVYFSMDPYDYQQNAGIKLLLKKLIAHSN